MPDISFGSQINTTQFAHWKTVELFSYKNTLNKGDMQTATKFESLPNEVLIHFFRYLDAIDIFHSFDHLNWRLSTLIRSLSLCLDLGKVENSILTQFGTKLSLNPQIKDQIISLIMKNNDAFDNFLELSLFVSVNEFTRLEALIFSNSAVTSIDQISSSLPLFPSLRYFSRGSSFDLTGKVLQSLTESIVTRLVVETIPHQAWFSHSFMSLNHLTVESCSINELCDFFNYSPIVQNLNIKNLISYDDRLSDESSASYGSLNHLKRLAIHYYDGQLDSLEVLLQNLPNLKFFMLHSNGDSDMADANRWRNLIKNALPLLDVFKFSFRFYCGDMDYCATDQFRLFQSDFWRDQHNWHIECIVNNNEAFIYTVPYIWDRYEVEFQSNRCYSYPVNNRDVFVNVTNLTVNIPAMSVIDRYHFPRVRSLTLNNTQLEKNHEYAYLRHKHIFSLRNVANLCNITHLEITSNCRLKSPYIMLHLMRDAVHLTSLKIETRILLQVWENAELCECLKRIKQLEIHRVWTSFDLNCEAMIKICQIFSNMEVFRCEIHQVDTLQTAMDHLSKLANMKFFSYKTFCGNCGDSWLREHRSELDLYSFKINCEYLALYDKAYDSCSYYDDDYADCMDW